ncbi:DoxX family protein [Saccharopolyspora tripterygii]
MFVVYVMVVAVTALLNAVSAGLDFAGYRQVRDNAEANGVPVAWLPMLGVLKCAGAVGLVAGLVGVPVVGALAAAGLVVFFVGAMVVHARARTWGTSGPAVLFLALAGGSLGLVLAV